VHSWILFSLFYFLYGNGIWFRVSNVRYTHPCSQGNWSARFSGSGWFTVTRHPAYIRLTDISPISFRWSVSLFSSRWELFSSWSDGGTLWLIYPAEIPFSWIHMYVLGYSTHVDRFKPSRDRVWIYDARERIKSTKRKHVCEIYIARYPALFSSII